jgi:hypothetical protein
VEYEAILAPRDNKTDTKVNPAHQMDVKQNQKLLHCFHHPGSAVRLHMDAMSLTGDKGSSRSPMRFLGRELKRERDATWPKGIIFVSIIIFTLGPETLRPNGRVMIINQSVDQANSALDHLILLKVFLPLD